MLSKRRGKKTGEMHLTRLLSGNSGHIGIRSYFFISLFALRGSIFAHLLISEVVCQFGLRHPEVAEVLRCNSLDDAFSVTWRFRNALSSDAFRGQLETRLRGVGGGYSDTRLLQGGSSRVVIELRDPDSF